ncbi:hypothetical protein C4577_02780 [Candidatus Parcubacteria bacterium]|nr:MAG: hypothetical protein C4577_02780 [Candidatus Parcubacteria bacterium]
MDKFPFTRATIFLLSSIIVLVTISMVLLYQSLSNVDFSKKKTINPEVKEVVKTSPIITPLTVSGVVEDIDQMDDDIQEVMSETAKDLSEVDDLDVTVDSQGL